MANICRRLIRSHKYRLYPNRAQEAALSDMLGHFCDPCNAGLQQRIEAWRRQGVSLGYVRQASELKAVRDAVPEHQLKAPDILEANVAQLGVAFIKAENVIVGRAGLEGFAGLRVIAAAEKIDPQTLVADLLNLASGDVRPGDLQASGPKMGDAFRGCGMGLILKIWLHQKIRRAAFCTSFESVAARDTK